MKSMDGTLESRLKRHARQLGFDLVGIAPAEPADGFERLKEWLAAGYAGTMAYLHKHANARHDPSSILPAVRSVVMVAMSYKSDELMGNDEAEPLPIRGKVARYARGADYHQVLWRRLERLLDWLQGERPGCHGRAVSDSAPLLERNFARRAGLGWIGKNTLLLNVESGSYIVLGALLVDIELRADEPYASDHCGSCRACLDACPTDAFPAPGVLDARRCISYLTIEYKGSVAADLRAGIGDWLFGCDVCQEVCPWNHKAQPGREPLLQPQPGLTALDAAELLGLSDEEFQRRFAGTALLRARRRGLLRNAAIVLGNAGDRSSLPALHRAVGDADPIVSEAAAAAIEAIEHRCAAANATC
jgi:epoxyqueuosine reductase